MVGRNDDGALLALGAIGLLAGIAAVGRRRGSRDSLPYSYTAHGTYECQYDWEDDRGSYLTEWEEGDDLPDDEDVADEIERLLETDQEELDHAAEYCKHTGDLKNIRVSVTPGYETRPTLAGRKIVTKDRW